MQLTVWMDAIATLSPTTPMDAPERMAGEALAGVVSAKRQEDYTWGELAGPLGLNPTTLKAFVAERGWTATPPWSVVRPWPRTGPRNTMTYSKLSPRDGNSEDWVSTVDGLAPTPAPYADDEVRELKAWYAMAEAVQEGTPASAEARNAGENFAEFVAARREAGDFSWVELAEPLGIQPQALELFLFRRGWHFEVRSQPAYMRASTLGRAPTPDASISTSGGEGQRPCRNGTPYTANERRQLMDWHALATTNRSTTPVGAPGRIAGDKFCELIAAKKAEGFSWRQLAEPLGLKGRTVHAYLARHGYTDRLEPSRPAYQNKSINMNHRTETHFPCGIHRIDIDPAYAPSKPGGEPRCASCEKEKRRQRYAEKERPRELARRASVEALREKNRTGGGIPHHELASPGGQS